jgi:hypothetical protein
VQHPAAQPRNEPQGPEEEMPDGETVREVAICCMSLQDNMMTLTGFVTDATNPCTTNSLAPRGHSSAAKTGAVGPGFDADLVRVVAAWPNLPDLIRCAVLALIASAIPAGPTNVP